MNFEFEEKLIKNATDCKHMHTHICDLYIYLHVYIFVKPLNTCSRYMDQCTLHTISGSYCEVNGLISNGNLLKIDWKPVTHYHRRKMYFLYTPGVPYTERNPETAVNCIRCEDWLSRITACFVLCALCYNAMEIYCS